MKFVAIALFATIAVAAAGLLPHVLTPGQDASAQVLRSEAVVNPDSFQYAYETSNGIQAQEQGQLKNFGPEQNAVVSQGSFSWVAPDGQTYSLRFVADENGFQPVADHLPVAPAPLH